MTHFLASGNCKLLKRRRCIPKTCHRRRIFRIFTSFLTIVAQAKSDSEQLPQENKAPMAQVASCAGKKTLEPKFTKAPPRLRSGSGAYTGESRHPHIGDPTCSVISSGNLHTPISLIVRAGTANKHLTKSSDRPNSQVLKSFIYPSSPSCQISLVISCRTRNNGTLNELQEHEILCLIVKIQDLVSFMILLKSNMTVQIQDLVSFMILLKSNMIVKIQDLVSFMILLKSNMTVKIQDLVSFMILLKSNMIVKIQDLVSFMILLKSNMTVKIQDLVSFMILLKSNMIVKIQDLVSFMILLKSNMTVKIQDLVSFMILLKSKHDLQTRST